MKAVTVRTLVNQSSIAALSKFSFPKRIDMKNGALPVFINDATSCVYTTLDCEYSSSPESGHWSMIAVYHQNIGFTIEEIINGFYEVVGDTFFLPIGYQRDKFIDFFLIRNQNEALKELIKNKLQILVREWKLPLLVKMQVSPWDEGHIRPKRVIGTYMQRKIKEASSFIILDFSNFSKEPEFADMIVSLKNKGVNKIFFDELNSIKSIKSNSNFRILKLCNNEITSLEHFKKLYDFKNIHTLDLSGNNIKNVNELQSLSIFDLKELNIIGNPCSNYPQLEQKLAKMSIKLQKLNSKIVFTASMDIDVNSQSGNRDITKIVDGILITTKNANNYRNRFSKLVYENYWSQVIFHHNKRYTLPQIMQELSTSLLRDVHFYPCYHKRTDNVDEFFLYRNFDALKKLYASGLKIQMPNGSHLIEVDIRLNAAEYQEEQVNWTVKIKQALMNRIKSDVLDLNDFPKDPEFSKVIVLMNSYSTLDFILTNAKNFNPNIRKITAENCSISNIKGLDEILFTFPKLTSLSLRNNNINNLNDFKNCPTILELFLDGNPVCNRSPFDYINHVRDKFKQVKWIDGHKVFENSSLVFFQNFLINDGLYMSVSTFVDRFFHLWDSFERCKLAKSMYNKSSVFTMSVYYDPSQEKFNIAKIYSRIQNLIKHSRNLVKMSNMSQTCSNVHVGHYIERVFGDMNQTRHDFTLMTVDVPFLNEEEGRIVIVVSGVFEEFLNETEEDPLVFSFTRTFLIKVTDGNFLITNDQLHLGAPSGAQIESLKRRVKTVTKQFIHEQCRNLMPSEFEGQVLKVEVLHKLTECSKQYCKKLLHDSKWDLKVALGSFISQAEKNRVLN